MKNLLVVVFVCCLYLHANALFEGELWETNEIDLGNQGDTTFYYLFRARNPATRYKTLVIWLTGGPGCSSSFSLFSEHGPYMFNKTAVMFRNEYSWNEEYDVMYVDQPVGTGYSLPKDENHYCKNETCVAKNFHKFLMTFYKEYHPEYLNVPLYIGGVSYGGHYVPAIGAYLLRANIPFIPLKGVAIGNGLTNLLAQFPAYPRFLLEEKLINWFTSWIAKLMISACSFGMNLGVKDFDLGCSSIIDTLAGYAKIINIYDIRRNDTDDKIDAAILNLLNKQETQDLFGLKKHRKVEEICSGKVWNYMLRDIPLSISSDLEYIMESGIKVLLYYGKKDYICNWRGGELLANSLKWHGQEGYLKEKYKGFNLGKEERGNYKKYENFIYMNVYDAGHMVPMDQREVAFHMIKSFINNTIS